MQQYKHQEDGTVITEGDGWCQLDFSECRSLTEVLRDIKESAARMKTAPILQLQELEGEPESTPE